MGSRDPGSTAPGQRLSVPVRDTRITGLGVTLVTMPFTRPESWAWHERTGLTSAVIGVHTDRWIDRLGEAAVAPGPTPSVMTEMGRRMEESVAEAPDRGELMTGRVLGGAGGTPSARRPSRAGLASRWRAGTSATGFASANARQGLDQMMSVPSQ